VGILCQTSELSGTNVVSDAINKNIMISRVVTSSSYVELDKSVTLRCGYILRCSSSRFRLSFRIALSMLLIILSVLLIMKSTLVHRSCQFLVHGFLLRALVGSSSYPHLMGWFRYLCDNLHYRLRFFLEITVGSSGITILLYFNSYVLVLLLR